MPSIPPVCDFNWPAPTFELPATDGEILSQHDISGPRGSLIIFMCNHCPYVLSVLDRIQRDARELQSIGIGVAAINANDAIAYPADSFENMVKLSQEHSFSFPYLHDETQSVAKAYGAGCTPDFFGFNAAGELQYRGRLDASGRTAGASDLRRDLFEAMQQIAKTGHGPKAQIASKGCSIKWK